MSVRHLEILDRKVRCYLIFGLSLRTLCNAFHNRAALDKETFETMWHDSEPGGKGELFFRHTHTEFRADGIDPSTWLEYMPNVSLPLDLVHLSTMHASLLNKRRHVVPDGVRK